MKLFINANRTGYSPCQMGLTSVHQGDDIYALIGGKVKSLCAYSISERSSSSE